MFVCVCVREYMRDLVCMCDLLLFGSFACVRVNCVVCRRVDSTKVHGNIYSCHIFAIISTTKLSHLYLSTFREVQPISDNTLIWQALHYDA